MAQPPEQRPMTDRALVRLHWPVALRPGFDALLAIDDALAEIALTASQPALAAITLAWWREALQRLDEGAVPAEPRLQAAASTLLPLGVSGVALSRLEEAWAGMLEEDAGAETAASYGKTLFGIAAKLLGTNVEADAGGAFGQASLLRRTGSVAWIGGMSAPGRAPRAMRPLTAFDALAWRDLQTPTALEAEASPARAWALLRHRWTGR
jgi:15-cis-phytoene synthase